MGVVKIYVQSTDNQLCIIIINIIILIKDRNSTSRSNLQFLLLVAFHLVYMLFLRIVFFINFIWWSSIKKLITMPLVMDFHRGKVWFCCIGGAGVAGSHLKILLRGPVLLRAAMLTAAMLTGQISC